MELRTEITNTGEESIIIIEGDMVEISKTIAGVKTSILEFEPDEGKRAIVNLSINVEIQDA